jgi:vacuolar-type H+-ATPase subunit I/STV1
MHLEVLGDSVAQQIQRVLLRDMIFQWGKSKKDISIKKIPEKIGSKMFNQESKIAVLESKLDMYEDLSREMLSKLESAVDKISEGNSRIATILAKHDERIEQSLKTDELLIKMIDEVKENNEKEHQEITRKFEKVEEKLEDVSRIKWMTIGCGVVLAILTTAFSTLASGWWTPSEIQVQTEGHTHQQTVAPDNK